VIVYGVFHEHHYQKELDSLFKSEQEAHLKSKSLNESRDVWYEFEHGPQVWVVEPVQIR
jgi:hypothetical protein